METTTGETQAAGTNGAGAGQVAIVNGHGHIQAANGHSNGTTHAHTLSNGAGPSGSARGNAKANSNGHRSPEDALMKMWYVSAPFEIVCVMDVVSDEGDGDPPGEAVEHPRPLLAVDFGHAVWIEYYKPAIAGSGGAEHGVNGAGGSSDDGEGEGEEEREYSGRGRGRGHAEDDDEMEREDDSEHSSDYYGNQDGSSDSDDEPPQDQQDEDQNGHPAAHSEAALHRGELKRLRFVSFPSISFEEDGRVVRSGIGGSMGDGSDDGDDDDDMWPMEGSVKTLEIPEELDLDQVETLNIDQSQGAVIMSVKEGRIFILCYE